MSHVLISMNKLVVIKIGNYTAEWVNSDCDKLLGVKRGLNINFNHHISDLNKKTRRKIFALVE